MHRTAGTGLAAPDRIERLVALHEACGAGTPADDVDVYIVAVGEGTLGRALALAEELHDRIDGLRVETNFGGGGFKAQMKRADKSNARYALILGEKEVAEDRVGLKPLRSTEDQSSVAWTELAATLAGLLGKA